MVDLDGLVGDAGSPALRQGFRERAVGGEMQVREQNLPAPQEGVFLGQRFLHLDDEVRLGKNGGVLANHRRPGLFVIGVRVAGTNARAAFDEDAVPVFAQLVRGRGQQRHAVFLLFDFLGDADNHRFR